jgi:hypothetical protein
LSGGGAQPSGRERFWALEGLKERLPAGDGAVLLAGLVLLAAGMALYFRVGTARRPPVEDRR